MNTDELVLKLSKGNKQDIKEAIWHIEKLPKISRKRFPPEYKELLFWIFKNFKNIKSTAHKVAILNALKLPLMYLGSKYYESCSEFLLQVMRNPDGNVREQAYHAANWFLTDITPDKSLRRKKDSENQSKQLIDFVVRLDQIAKEHKKKARGLLYLNDMKPCPYKSIQKFLRRILTNEWYMKTIHLAGYMEYPSDNEIFEDENYDFWEITPPHLELHEMQFAMELRKGERLATSQKTGYQFKVSLHNNKRIYRIIEINPNLSLYSLAEAIIGAFDFYFDHCFGFFNQIDDGRLFNSSEKYELFNDLPDVEPTDAGSVRLTKIKDVWTHIRKTIYFLFDYGDNWIFEVDLIDINVDSDLSQRNFYDVVESVGKSPNQYPDGA